MNTLFTNALELSEANNENNVGLQDNKLLMSLYLKQMLFSRDTWIILSR